MAMINDKLRIALLTIVLIPISLPAQENMTITGRITNFETSEPMHASSVMVIGMPIGVATSSSGLYRLQIPMTRINADSITITVNHIGYKSAMITIPVKAGPNMMDFYLTADAIVMKEVVVASEELYEPSRKEKARGYRVDVLDIDELRATGTNNAILAIKAKVAGVVSGGQTMSTAPSMQMRGRRYLSNASNGQPLIVVDDMPFTHDFTNMGTALNDGSSDQMLEANLPPQTERATLNGIVPTAVTGEIMKIVMNTINDIGIINIATIEVVKGPGMFWRYGNAASNGCIIITTKKGSQ